MQLKASIATILAAAVFAADAAPANDRVIGPHVQGSKIPARPTPQSDYELRYAACADVPMYSPDGKDRDPGELRCEFMSTDGYLRIGKCAVDISGGGWLCL